MKHLGVVGVAVLVAMLAATYVEAQEIIGGGLRGALVGGLLGDKKGAKRGAAIGAGVGALRKMDRRAQENEYRREAQARAQYQSTPQYQSSPHVNYNQPVYQPTSPSSYSSGGGTSQINRDIQMIEQRYGREAADCLRRSLGR